MSEEMSNLVVKFDVKENVEEGPMMLSPSFGHLLHCCRRRKLGKVKPEVEYGILGRGFREGDIK
jgi:hypothetical protein